MFLDAQRKIVNTLAAEAFRNKHSASIETAMQHESLTMLRVYATKLRSKSWRAVATEANAIKR
jgi:hypothetical protein